MPVLRALSVALLPAVGLSATAHAQPITYETEPNDDPLTLETEVRGAVMMRGEALGGDQDAFWWIVGEEEAGRFWEVELRSRTEGLVQLDMVRLESDEEIIEEARNGRVAAATASARVCGWANRKPRVARRGLLSSFRSCRGCTAAQTAPPGRKWPTRRATRRCTTASPRMATTWSTPTCLSFPSRCRK